MPLILRDEYLEISGVPLCTPAFQVLSLTPLLQGPDVRNLEPVKVPGLPGGIPRAPVVDVFRRQVPMLISGDADLNNTPYSDVREGWEINLEYLLANVVRPPGGDGTRLAKIYLRRATLTAYVTVVPPLQLGKLNPSETPAVLDLQFPRGDFA